PLPFVTHGQCSCWCAGDRGRACRPPASCCLWCVPPDTRLPFPFGIVDTLQDEDSGLEQPGSDPRHGSLDAAEVLRGGSLGPKVDFVTAGQPEWGAWGQLRVGAGADLAVAVFLRILVDHG